MQHQDLMNLARSRWGKRLQSVMFERGHGVAVVWDDGPPMYDDSMSEEEWDDLYYGKPQTVYLIDTGEVMPETLPCMGCHHECPTGIAEEPDPCWDGFLPGVRFACCGHGTTNGYVLMDDGLRLTFEPDDRHKVADMTKRLARLDDLATSQSTSSA